MQLLLALLAMLASLLGLAGRDEARVLPYAGGNAEPISSPEIIDYRNRQFDPATGRFLQRDPVLGGDELFNPYCFPGNNPVTGSDPMGTKWVWNKGDWHEFGREWCPRPNRDGFYEGEVVGPPRHSPLHPPYSDAEIEAYKWEAGMLGKLGCWFGIGGTYDQVLGMRISNAQWRGVDITGVMARGVCNAGMEAVNAYRAGLEPATALTDTATHVATAVTGMDVRTEWSLAYDEGGALDRVEAVDRSMKETETGAVARYYVSGFYGSADFMGVTNYYNAATMETDVFAGNEIAGVYGLKGWREAGEQATIGLIKTGRVTAVATGALAFMDRYRPAAPRARWEPQGDAPVINLSGQPTDVQGRPGFMTVVAHGDIDTPTINVKAITGKRPTHTGVTPEVFARYLKRSHGYTGQPVQLVVCYTGKTGFAEGLSGALGGYVCGPNAVIGPSAVTGKLLIGKAVRAAEGGWYILPTNPPSEMVPFVGRR